jgi:hypothetical protein
MVLFSERFGKYREQHVVSKVTRIDFHKPINLSEPVIIHESSRQPKTLLQRNLNPERMTDTTPLTMMGLVLPLRTGARKSTVFPPCDVRGFWMVVVYLISETCCLLLIDKARPKNKTYI